MNRHSLESSLKRSLAITVEDIHELVGNFHHDMKAGLGGKLSSLKMLPTFVDKPSGKEKGSFLALDFGGTNFRVLHVNLDGRGSARITHADKFVIPKAVMHGTGVQLFNFIAGSIRKFIEENLIGFEDKRKLGFTFSFPMKQTTVASGTLINWTKGFSATGVVGRDVVIRLKDSLKRCGLHHIDVAALANDTVGTMAAGSYKHPDCDVGIIFGTGTNACYREKRANITKLAKTMQRSGHMVINIEWGNFDKLPFTLYDERLDKSTNNPGRQRMEKMISGMYLGEVARLILSDLMRNKFIFAKSGGRFSKGDFKSRHMSMIEADRSRNLTKVKEYLEGVGILNTSLEERCLLKEICMMVSQRAARISAAAISAVISWMDPQLGSDHTIAIDGTLYEKYPDFRKTILATLKEIYGVKSKRLKLVIAKEGSGIGVAIVAAVAASQR